MNLSQYEEPSEDLDTRLERAKDALDAARSEMRTARLVFDDAKEKYECAVIKWTRADRLVTNLLTQASMRHDR